MIVDFIVMPEGASSGLYREQYRIGCRGSTGKAMVGVSLAGGTVCTGSGLRPNAATLHRKARVHEPPASAARSYRGPGLSDNPSRSYRRSGITARFRLSNSFWGSDTEI